MKKIEHTIVLLLFMVGIEGLAQNLARSFDGNDDYISLLDPAVFESTQSDDFTIELWFQSDDVTGYSTWTRLFENYENDSNEDDWLQLAIPNTGVVGGLIFLMQNDADNPARHSVFSDFALSAGIWYHVAITWDADADDLKMYINGDLQTNTSTTSSGTTGGNDGDNEMVIGGRLDHAGDFTGQIDEFRIWSDIRSQSEIRNYMYQEVSYSADGLEVYFPMDEASGANVDNLQGSSSYNGTANGTAIVPSAAWYDTKTCLYFDGDADYVLCDAGTNHNSTSVITIESMVYLNNSTSDNDRILYRTESGATNLSGCAYALNFNTSNQPRFTIDGITITADDACEQSRWYHIAGTYDKDASNDQMKLYLDGELVKTGSNTNDIPTSSCNSYDLSLGASYDGSSTTDYYLHGYLDETRVWQKCLTQEEIRANMFNVLTGEESNLAMYWKFDQTDGTSLPDADNGGTVADGTITDCSWASSHAFNIWLNTNSGDWTLASNWSNGSVPAVSYGNVGIHNLGGTSPGITGAQEINNFYVGTGAFVTLEASCQFSVNRNLVNDGQILMKSDASSTASLIDNGLVSGSGIWQVERYLLSDQWSNFSPPVQDMTSGVFELPLVEDPDVFILENIEASSSYTYIEGDDVALNPLQGYLIWVDGDEASPNVSNWTFTFEGTPNTGTMGADNNLTISTPGGNGMGWNLVGNPYLSSIDWAASSGWARSGVDASTYIYAGGGTGMPTWATYTSGSGATTNGGSRYISTAQSFFVKVTDPGSGYPVNGTLKMDNDVRVHQNAAYFKNKDNTEKLIKLSMTNGSYTDEINIGIFESSTVGFDPLYDAHKLLIFGAEVPQFYTF